MRTRWHRHETGQILIVTHGRGLAVNENGDGGATPGDLVWFDPGELHWHGGGPDPYVSHIAISLGTTDWEEPVTDDEYAAGTG